MKGEKVLIAGVGGGLGNRLLSYASGRRLSKKLNRKFIHLWQKTGHCDAEFEDLFEPVKKIKRINRGLTKFKEGTIKNYVLDVEGAKNIELYAPGGKTFPIINVGKDDEKIFLNIPDIAFLEEEKYLLKDNSYLNKVNQEIGSYIRELSPKKEIAEKIESFAKANFNEKTVSLHLRGTDKNGETNNWKKGIIKKLKKFLGVNSRFKIFLATDSKDIEKAIKVKFGNRIIIYPKKYWPEKEAKNKKWRKNIYRSRESLIEALIELYLLSMTRMRIKLNQKLIFNKTTFSEAAAALNPHQRIINIEKNLKIPLKIAIFHNFIDNIGGAEIVALTLARELNADIYTTNIDFEKIKNMGFEEIIPRIKSIGRVPINAPFKQQAALKKFRKLNLGKKYDFYIIAGDWAMSGAVNNKPNLWYAHSPLNEIFGFKEFVRKMLKPWKRPLFDLWATYIKMLVIKYTPHINKLVCNSGNTQKRIRFYLKREAEIINPPIESSKYKSGSNGNYWLAVNRLITNKRVDMQLKSFAKMPDKNLVIVGSYEKARHFQVYANYIKKVKTNNVEIKSWLSQKELLKLYAKCKGFITTSRDEDFGMAPVEAMCSGKPVIAPREGGYKETIIDGETGILIEEINSEKIIEAIKKIETNLKKNKNYYKKSCIKQAKKFEVKIFMKKINTEINHAIKNI